MSAAVFAMGAGLGLCVGLVCGVGSGLAAGISMEKKRVRKAIGILMRGGELKLQGQQGAPISEDEIRKKLRLPAG